MSLAGIDWIATALAVPLIIVLLLFRGWIVVHASKRWRRFWKSWQVEVVLMLSAFLAAEAGAALLR